MLHAVTGGVAVTLLCAPYLHSQPPPGLYTIRLAFLFPVSVLLFQAAMAWRPLAPAPAWLAGVKTANAWLFALLAACACGMFQATFVDDTLAQAHPNFFPHNLAELGRLLPWVVFFQTLVTIAGVYAFAARFWRSAAVCALGVATVRVLFFISWAPGLPPGFYVLLQATTIAAGLFMALVYARLGLPGIWVATLAMQARFLLTLQ